MITVATGFCPSGSNAPSAALLASRALLVRQRSRAEAAGEQGLAADGMAICQLAFFLKGSDEVLLERDNIRLSPKTAPAGIAPEAFEELYAHARERVFVWLRWLLRQRRSTLDPQDLLQDTFIFDDGDTGLNAARDRITDFEQGNDRIDLGEVDAQIGGAGGGGDQAFVWGGFWDGSGPEFTGLRQIRFHHDTDDNTIVDWNNSGGTGVDAQIVVVGHYMLVVGDFNF